MRMRDRVGALAALTHLRALSRVRGVTWTGLSRKVFGYHSYLTDVQGGRRELRFADALAVLEALDVPPWQFFGELYPPPVAALPPAPADIPSRVEALERGLAWLAERYAAKPAAKPRPARRERVTAPSDAEIAEATAPVLDALDEIVSRASARPQQRKRA